MPSSADPADAPTLPLWRVLISVLAVLALGLVDAQRAMDAGGWSSWAPSVGCLVAAVALLVRRPTGRLLALGVGIAATVAGALPAFPGRGHVGLSGAIVVVLAASLFGQRAFAAFEGRLGWRGAGFRSGLIRLSIVAAFAAAALVPLLLHEWSALSSTVRGSALVVSALALAGAHLTSRLRTAGVLVLALAGLGAIAAGLAAFESYRAELMAFQPSRDWCGFAVLMETARIETAYTGGLVLSTVGALLLVGLAACAGPMRAFLRADR